MTLEVRRARFDWTGTPLHWIPGDPHTAKVIDVLHLLLPTGERWFARILKQSLPYIDDAQLRADIDGFMRQEGWHASAHVAVGDFLAARGVDIEPFTREVERWFELALGDRPFGKRLPKRLQKPWLAFRLAAVAGIEHYTCVLGMWALSGRGLDAAGADPTMLDLIRWHASEEVEHRAVAFEAGKHVGIGWPMRNLAFAFVVPLLWFAWIRGAQFLTAADPTVGSASWWKTWRAGRADRLPTIPSLLRATLRYASPWYSPHREGDDAVSQAYLETSRALHPVAA